MSTEAGPLFPFNDPISEEVGGQQLVQFRWRRWFLRLREAVDNAAVAIPVPPVLNATASQPTTEMDNGTLSAGLYSVAWYLEIVTTEAASSARVTISWVSLTVPKSYVASIVDGSIAGNTQPDVKLLIYSDAASPITYTVAYVGATMTYNFRPVLQSVSTS